MSWLRPFARHHARIEATLDALERAAAAAEAERARLAKAVEVSHRALLMLHDRLADWADQPARATAATKRLEETIRVAEARALTLVEHAHDRISEAAANVGRTAADRLAAELAPARAAAEGHAAFLGASLERLRAEAGTLAGAQAASDALTDLTVTAGAEIRGAARTITRRKSAR